MAALHYRSYVLIHRSQDTNIGIFKLVICKQISICYSLLSITWLFSRFFINGFDTTPLAAVSAYGSGTATHESAMSKARRRNDSARPQIKHPWQDDGIHSRAICRHPKGSIRANRSFGSEEIIFWRDDEAIVSSSADGGVMIVGSISPQGDYR
jgi:hypothetical protein